MFKPGQGAAMQMRVKRLTPSATLPRYAHRGDAGLDLYAAEDLVIPPTEARTVRTGIAVELPPGTEAVIRPRSGLAREWAVTVLNSPGTIDEGYRGEVGVILINHGGRDFRVECGMRVGQLVVQRRLRVEVIEVKSLTETERGGGGFGSTGL